LTGPVRAKGLKLDRGLVNFAFKPSVGIVAKRIDILGLDIRSFREPLTEAVKKVMIPSIQKNFRVGGRPPWEPLAEYTQTRRAGDGFSAEGPILVRKGTLQRNMGFMSIWTINQNFAAIKDLPARIWYGKVQQEGYGSFASVVRDLGGDVKGAIERTGQATDRKTAIPARPFVDIQPEDARAIQDIFDTWLAKRALLAGYIPGRR
jgi:phage gpG-like protein